MSGNDCAGEDLIWSESHQENGTGYAERLAGRQAGGARMADEKSNQNADAKAEVLRLIEECRKLLEQTGDVAKRLQELTDKLSGDQADQTQSSG